MTTYVLHSGAFRPVHIVAGQRVILVDGAIYQHSDGVWRFVSVDEPTRTSVLQARGSRWRVIAVRCLKWLRETVLLRLQRSIAR